MGQAQARSGQVLGLPERLIRAAFKRQLKGQPVQQRRRQLLVVVHALVQRHQGNVGGVQLRQALAFQPHLVGVQGGAQLRRHVGGHALGHAQHQPALVGLGQKTWLGLHPAAVQAG